jgi:hypothetical protein
MSCCPGGDLSVDLWGENARDPLETCNPLDVDVYALDEQCLRGWQPPEPAPYRGAHGRRAPEVDWAARKQKKTTG